MPKVYQLIINAQSEVYHFQATDCPSLVEQLLAAEPALLTQYGITIYEMIIYFIAEAFEYLTNEETAYLMYQAYIFRED